MVLIIGGAYQGKTAYAQTKYALRDAEIFTCEGEALDLTARCLRHLERFAELSRMDMALQEYVGPGRETAPMSDKDFEPFYKELADCLERRKTLQEKKTAAGAAGASGAASSAARSSPSSSPSSSSSSAEAKCVKIPSGSNPGSRTMASTSSMMPSSRPAS